MILRSLTGFLWRFQAFRLLTLKLVRHAPRKFAWWWAVNTPLAVALHHILINSGDFEGAAGIVRETRKRPGAWS